MPQDVVLIVRIQAKSGRKRELVEHLEALVETMKSEASFRGAVIHDNLDRPDEVVVYETWVGSRESWLAEEFPRPYRAGYEAVLAELIDDRAVDWLTPVTRYGAPGRA